MRRRDQILRDGLKIADFICRVRYGKPAVDLFGEFMQEHKIPQSKRPEELTEEMVAEAMFDTFGVDMRDDGILGEERGGVDILGGGEYEEPRFGSGMGEHNEYANFFRRKYEEAQRSRPRPERPRKRRRRKRQRTEVPPEEPEPQAMSEAEARRVLGVKANVDEATLRRAYWGLAKKYHPDVSHLSREEATEKFRVVTEAYDVLRSGL